MLTPNVCSMTLPTSAEIGLARACVARALRMSVCVCVGLCNARSSGATACGCDRCTSLNSSARTSVVGSGGSDLSAHCSASMVPTALPVTR